MNRERFEALAQAYGGDLDRWPAEAVASARALLKTEAGLAAVLDEANAVDLLLAASPSPGFSGILRERVIGGAPRLRTAWKATTRWLSGAGLAAACAAGVLLGVNMSDRIAGDPVGEALTAASTSFDAQADIIGIGEIG